MKKFSIFILFKFISSPYDVFKRKYKKKSALQHIKEFQVLISILAETFRQKNQYLNDCFRIVNLRTERRIYANLSGMARLFKVRTISHFL